MRTPAILAATVLLLVTTPAFAEDPAMAPSANPSPPAPADAAATSAPAAATPASTAPKQIFCEYKEHEGLVVPLRECVTKDEATRRRIRQQESIREFQMQSLTQQPH